MSISLPDTSRQVPSAHFWQNGCRTSPKQSWDLLPVQSTHDPTILELVLGHNIQFSSFPTQGKTGINKPLSREKEALTYRASLKDKIIEPAALYPTCTPCNSMNLQYRSKKVSETKRGCVCWTCRKWNHMKVL